MKRVVILKLFNDLTLGRWVKIGEVLELDEKHAEKLVNHPARIAKYADEQPETTTVKAEQKQVDPEVPSDPTTDLTPPQKDEESFNKPAKKTKATKSKKAKQPKK